MEQALPNDNQPGDPACDARLPRSPQMSVGHPSHTSALPRDCCPSRPPLLRSCHGDLRTTIARRPQPDAVRRFGGSGGHPRQAARHGPPHPYRPAGRRHRGEGEPRHRPPAVEPEILPDGQRHQTGRRDSWLCDALGLRAGLPGVQGVADAAHPPDGRGCHRLPSRRLTVPRHRRPPVPRGVPPQGPLRRHHHPPRRPQLRRGAPGPGPTSPVALRPAEGHRGVRLLPPS